MGCDHNCQPSDNSSLSATFRRLIFPLENVLPTKANIHGAAADLVEHHLGRELIRPSGTAAGVEEASFLRHLHAPPEFNRTQYTGLSLCEGLESVDAGIVQN